MAELLITSSDIINYCNASSNIPPAQFTRFIREAQIFDIIPLIGYEYVEDILAELDVSPELPTSSLSDLYNGKTYSRTGDTVIWRYEGLKMAMAYCAYKRLLEEQSVNLTAFGVVQKTDDYSLPLTDVQMGRIINKVNEKVIVLKAQVEKFLCDFSTTYTKWQGNFDKRDCLFKEIGE